MYLNLFLYKNTQGWVLCRKRKLIFSQVWKLRHLRLRYQPIRWGLSASTMVSWILCLARDDYDPHPSVKTSQEVGPWQPNRLPKLCISQHGCTWGLSLTMKSWRKPNNSKPIIVLSRSWGSSVEKYVKKDFSEEIISEPEEYTKSHQGEENGAYTRGEVSVWC